MNGQPILRVILALAYVLTLGASPGVAEELTLRDGQKIVGTIVGYENGMFRVETAFGFALVRKDKVTSINFTPSTPLAAVPKHDERSNSTPNEAPSPRPSEKPSVIIPGISTLVLEAGSAPRPPATPPALAVPGVPPPNLVKAAPPPVSRPLNEPLPTHIQEHLEGSNYVNDTFQFAMFKPPGWKIYEGVPRETGSGIMAMGTEDEQTLLIVDGQAWSGPPDLKSPGAEANLRRPYQDFQKLSESSVRLDGHPAIRRLFRGLIDGVEWHGLSVHLARGNTVFGIVGLTSAETFQFQQAVFNKIVNSLRFLTRAPEAASWPQTAAPSKAEPRP